MAPAENNSDVYDAYWRFAAARQDIYLRRLRGQRPPWTTDPVLSAWRFTNVFRASDRVSQYLIRHVIYAGDQDPSEVVFRILLFKWFNRISTWELLTERLGPLRLAEFDQFLAEKVLTEARRGGERVYSAAYIVPPVPGEPGPKHAGHLALTVRMLNSDLVRNVVASRSLEELYLLLREWPGIGPFLAFQFAIDINYSAVVDHDENEFVVAGPGALDGLAKAWPGADLHRSADLIRITAVEQEQQFARRGLTFTGLFGRPLKLIDCQNLYCEIGKYARQSHPDARGVAHRTRIKQSYRASGTLAPLPRPFFPPKWRLSVPADLWVDVSAAKCPEQMHLSLGV
jgi:hypothetical protein